MNIYTPGDRYQDARGTTWLVLTGEPDPRLLDEGALDEPEPLAVYAETAESVESYGPLTRLDPAPDLEQRIRDRWDTEADQGRREWDAMSGLQKVLSGGGVPSWEGEMRDAHTAYMQADAALKAAQARVEEMALRRGQAVATMVSLAGNQSLAAAALEIDQSNVSRSVSLLRKPREHVERQALADYQDTALPRAGELVPSVQAWQSLPASQRPGTAAKAAAAWSAIAAANAGLARQCKQAAEVIGEALLYRDEWSTDAELAALTRQALPQWGEQLPVTEAEHGAMLGVLQDMADAHLARHRVALREADAWAQRAGASAPSISYAD